MKQIATKSATDIDELLKRVKQKTGLTQEQIAGKIGYNRAYISQAKKTDSEKLYNALYKEFRPMLDNITQKIEAPEPVNSKEQPLEWSQIAEANLINAKSMAKMVAMLEERDKQLEKINASLMQLPKDMIALTAKLQEGQRSILAMIGDSAPGTSHSKKPSHPAKQ